MKLLFIGDVVGKTGRKALKKHLPDLISRLESDIVIVNGENAAHGFGITEKICNEFYSYGVDCITTGNHVWKQREVFQYIDRDPCLLRPINFSQDTVGQGKWEKEFSNGHKIAVINIMGRVFMEQFEDPFVVIKDILKEMQLGHTHNLIFVDFHGEATSEKMAFAQYLDGEVSAVVGTHTHIPTADYQILSKGTAYQSDAGMVGDYDSVIGSCASASISHFLANIPNERLVPADGEATLCGTYIVTDDLTGLATSIQPIRLGGKLDEARPF